MGEESIYALAMEVVDRLVEDALEEIYKTADNNSYEREWMVVQFRNRFNRKTKDIV